MPDFDSVIRHADNHPFLGIIDGKIAALAGEGSGREEIDATGHLLMPGVIDSHVHFNEPGRTDWEGFHTGSRAAAAGGVTTFFDMPLNSNPPTVTVEAFREKAALGREKSITDFGLWGGLIPGYLDHLEPVWQAGVIGFKAFMSGSGIDEFPKSDATTLREGMRRVAPLGALVAVHAELDEKNTSAGVSIADFLASRPISSEVAAIHLACELAGETGAKLHIVHVSSVAGLEEVLAAKSRGVDVTCETCPHYLVLTSEDVERLGAVAKCAPPIRSREERDALLGRVKLGQVQTIGSDHSPAPPAMKVNDNFFKIWGGIAGIQHLLPLLLETGLSVEMIGQLTRTHVARRFGLPTKNGLQVGQDADFSLVKKQARKEILQKDLHYRHPQSPYVGLFVHHEVAHTFLRGRSIYDQGVFPRQHGGQLLIPHRD